MRPLELLSMEMKQRNNGGTHQFKNRYSNDIALCIPLRKERYELTTYRRCRLIEVIRDKKVFAQNKIPRQRGKLTHN